MESYWKYGSKRSWPRNYMEMSGQFHAPAALSPGKEPPVPIGQDAGWAPEPVLSFEREEKSLPLPEIGPRFPGIPARCLMTVLLRTAPTHKLNWTEKNYVGFEVLTVVSRFTQATDGETVEENRREVLKGPITVAARSEAWTIFARSNAGVVGSNPTQGMGVCLPLFCVCVGSGLATG
jgi:hypothetical protein